MPAAKGAATAPARKPVAPVDLIASGQSTSGRAMAAPKAAKPDAEHQGDDTKTPPAASAPAPPRSGAPRNRPSPSFSLPNPTRSGAGGGLLLALVLYPIGLSVVKYGPKGPGMWFRAKFLNKPANANNTTPGGTFKGPGLDGSMLGITAPASYLPKATPGKATGTTAAAAQPSTPTGALLNT